MTEVLSLDELFFLGQVDLPVNVKMAEKGIAMKFSQTGEIKSIHKDNITRIELFRSTRRFGMRVFTKGGIIELNNILEEMIEEIKKSIGDWYNLLAYMIPLEVTNTTKGSVSFSDHFLEYRTGKLIFDIPLKDIVSVCSVKNEVVLGFEADDSTEGVTEMRLTVPDENFVSNLRERSETGQSKSIFTFEEMNNVSPRGKSDFIFNQNCLRIIGKTFEHKVLYSSIKRCIEIPGEKNVNVVLDIDPPIQQGLTRYNFINTTFDKEIEEDFVIDVDENIKSKFPDLENSYSGELFKTYLAALEIFTRRPIEQLSNFRNHSGQNFVSCNFKAAESLLYFTGDGILILPKVIFIKFSHIRIVKFSRVDVSVMTSKLFDMVIRTFDGEYQMSAIEKDEFCQIESFLSKKNVELSVDIVEHHVSDDEDDSTTDINDTDSSGVSEQSSVE